MEYTANESSVRTTAPNSPYAVTIKNGFMQYKSAIGFMQKGSKQSNRLVVLDNFNMTILRGHIYGLLGASGCGKTTVLRAVVGQHRLSGGEIRVLGHQPGTPESGIPGTTVGYMPQELSLFEDLTISQTLRFYGWIKGLSSSEIDYEYGILTNLLNLQHIKHVVGSLSGGEKRRVSFAIALLRSPPILILDEPTVGVDSMLRESVWKHMKKLSTEKGTTIFITTHYIEEAIEADTVGLMRHGKLIAEDSPRTLIRSLECSNLEEVLFKLSLFQSSNRLTSPESENSFADLNLLPINERNSDRDKKSSYKRRRVAHTRKLQTLIWKNIIYLLRHWQFTILLTFFLPLMNVYLFCTTVGNPPTYLHVSVFNEDNYNCFSKETILNAMQNGDNTSLNYCEIPKDISCKMLTALEEKQLLLVNAPALESAEEDVRRGRSWAAVIFPKNFSLNLIRRAEFSLNKDIDDEVIDRGTVYLARDSSNAVIAGSIYEDVRKSIKKILFDFDEHCRVLGPMKEIPMRFNDPIDGKDDVTFRDTMLPGLLVNLIFAYSVITAVSTFSPDNFEGCVERCMVLGVVAWEVMLAHFVTDAILAVLQVLISIYSAYGLYPNYMVGRYIVALSVSLATAVMGLFSGLLIASVTTGYVPALFFSVGSISLAMFTSGMLRPLESVPSSSRVLFQIMPATQPTAALLGVVQRGWTLKNKGVLLSFLSTFAWSAFFLVATTAFWSLKKR